MTYKQIALCIAMSLMLVGCSPKRPPIKDGPPKHIPPNLLQTPNAIPKIEPLSRYGNRFNKGTSNSYVVFGKRYHVMKTSRGYKAKGTASWYGTQFHGRRTSNGERYDMFAMTGAHRSLPLPTYARVTNLHNRKSIIIKFNDRGPFHGNRLIDLSYVAAAKLGILGNGTAHVEVESIDPRDHPPTYEYRHVVRKRKLVPSSPAKARQVLGPSRARAPKKRKPPSARALSAPKRSKARNTVSKTSKK